MQNCIPSIKVKYLQKIFKKVSYMDNLQGNNLINSIKRISKLKSFNGLSMDGPLVIEPRIFKDERGCFFESFNLKDFSS